MIGLEIQCLLDTRSFIGCCF